MKFKNIKHGLSLTPYPHCLIENYADEEEFTKLSKELIQFETEVRKKQDEGDKTIYSTKSPKFTSATTIEINEVTEYPAIKKFFQHFASTSFLVEVAEALSDYAQGRMKIKPEDIIEIAKGKQGINYIYLKMSSKYIPKVRDAHVDGPYSLLTFLYFVRLPNDFSTGGDLYLHSGENQRSLFSRLKKKINLNVYRFTKTVEYKANTLIVFFNGPDSIHEVSIRNGMNINRIAFQGGLNSLEAEFFTPRKGVLGILDQIFQQSSKKTFYP